MSELEAAAERLRRLTNGDRYSSIYPQRTAGEASLDQIEDEQEVIATYLAEHDPTPLDEGWLRSVGFEENHQNFRDRKSLRLKNVYLNAYACEGPKCWTWILGHCGHDVKTDPARGDVRRLCQCLGIHLKEQT